MPKVVSEIVEVCVFRNRKGTIEYLLLRRADLEKIYPGIWQIATGRIRKKETALKTAVRELKEETGLRAKRIWHVPYIPSFMDPLRDVIHLAAVFAVEVDSDDEVILSKEHQDFKWMTFHRGLAKLPLPGQKQILICVEEYISSNVDASSLWSIKNYVLKGKIHKLTPS
jgi:dATP pyrophosphohydrolase